MKQLNIYDEPLHECCSDPLTGFFRDGFCNTNEYDHGLHIVCCLIDNNFLDLLPILFLLKDMDIEP